MLKFLLQCRVFGKHGTRKLKLFCDYSMQPLFSPKMTLFRHFGSFFKHGLIKLSACLCFLKMSNFGPQFERKHARQISTVDKSEELILHTFNDFLNVAYYMSNKNQGPKILK